MDQAVQQSDSQVIHIGGKRSVEIVVHISEELDEGQRNNLVSALKGSTGISDAEFCPSRSHLMLVRYDRDIYSSKDVLSTITTRNLSARLIGPV